MSFSDQMIEALTFIEQRFWEDGGIPTNEAVSQATGIRLDTIEGYWKNPDFRTALVARGVTFDNQRASGSLTMEQLLVANMLMNTADRRSLREKLKDFPQLTPQKVQGWMRQPAFQEHLQRRAQVMFEHAKPAAYREMARAIEGGDLKAIQLYFEMTGIYNPKVQIEVDVNVLLIRVVEIVTKHVKDPAILASIAGELEELGVAPQPAPAVPQLPAVQNRVSLSI